MDVGRERGKAAARGKVKAVIIAVEAAVNEARNHCKKRTYNINKIIL